MNTSFYWMQVKQHNTFILFNLTPTFFQVKYQSGHSVKINTQVLVQSWKANDLKYAVAETEVILRYLCRDVNDRWRWSRLLSQEGIAGMQIWVSLV